MVSIAVQDVDPVNNVELAVELIIQEENFPFAVDESDLERTNGTAAH